MIHFAFKIASKLPPGVERNWSMLVATASGSIYSHVEVWLNGDIKTAYCFSSREPHGAGFQVIDLSAPEWEIVPLNTTPDQEKYIWGYCLGADGKGYDGVGLLGFGKIPAIHDFRCLHCSETAANILAKCLKQKLSKLAWMLSPGDICTLVKGIKYAS